MKIQMLHDKLIWQSRQFVQLHANASYDLPRHIAIMLLQMDGFARKAGQS